MNTSWERPNDDQLSEFLQVMRRLRVECDWKRGQTHRSLARYLLEETHELIEALDLSETEPDDELLREELGDVLLQVIFHATIAEERGAFSMGDVASTVREKMIRRNPHVFGPGDGTGATAEQLSAEQVTAEQVTEAWEQIKATEKQRTHITEGLAPTLPALLYADKVVDRAERAGTPVVPDGSSDDLGERLLALVAEAHAAGRDPEQLLRDTVRRHLL